MCSARGPVRLRARRALPGQAAHGRGRQCGARRARRGSLEQLVLLRRQVPSLSEESWAPASAGAQRMNEAVKNRELKEQDRPGLRMGLRLRHRAGIRAQGPERRHRPLHLGQEERARVDARLAAQGLSRLARDGGGQLGQARHPRDRLPGRLLLRRAQGEAEARQPRRGRSRNPARLREARHPDRGAEGARRGRRRAQGRGRRGVRQRLASPPPSARS